MTVSEYQRRYWWRERLRKLAVGTTLCMTTPASICTAVVVTMLLAQINPVVYTERGAVGGTFALVLMFVTAIGLGYMKEESEAGPMSLAHIVIAFFHVPGAVTAMCLGATAWGLIALGGIAASFLSLLAFFIVDSRLNEGV